MEEPDRTTYGLFSQTAVKTMGSVMCETPQGLEAEVCVISTDPSFEGWEFSDQRHVGVVLGIAGPGQNNDRDEPSPYWRYQDDPAKLVIDNCSREAQVRKTVLSYYFSGAKRVRIPTRDLLGCPVFEPHTPEETALLNTIAVQMDTRDGALIPLKDLKSKVWTNREGAWDDVREGTVTVEIRDFLFLLAAAATDMIQGGWWDHPDELYGDFDDASGAFHQLLNATALPPVPAAETD